MKRFLLTTVAFGVLALPAMAADMNPAPVYRAPPPPVPVAIFTWTGCYIGGTVGGVWGSSTDTWAPAAPALGGFTPAGAAAIASQTATTLSSSGVTGGVEGGCNYQYTPWLVLGIEADWQATGLSASNNGAVTVGGASAPFTQSFNSHWLSTVRGRAGYAAGPWLFFASGGVAIANTSFSDTISIPGLAPGVNSVSQSQTSSGWTVGGGVEWAFAPNWTVKGEYLYVDIPGVTFASVNSNPLLPLATITHTHGDLKENIARVGVNYKFW
jgi:outer membrane immunogenic protein